jgi:mannan endo-1,4-beta-mannosidase
MRWPNRDPHILTPGMRAAQLALAGFLPLIDWPRFRRRNLHGEIAVEGGGTACFTCGDEQQVVLWLLRTDCIAENGRVYRDGRPAQVRLLVPGLRPGRYRVICWDTRLGRAADTAELDHGGAGPLTFRPPGITADLAIAIRRIG